MLPSELKPPQRQKFLSVLHEFLDLHTKVNKTLYKEKLHKQRRKQNVLKTVREKKELQLKYDLQTKDKVPKYRFFTKEHTYYKCRCKLN